MEPVNTICICKNCGCVATKNKTNPSGLVCKKCQSTDFEDTKISPQEWGNLSHDVRKGRVQQVIKKASITPSIAPSTSTKNQTEIDNQKEKLSINEQEEVKKHNTGCLIFFGGIFVIVLACFMHGGTAAAVVGVIGFGLILYGFFPAINNRSASKIREDNSKASAIVSSWVAKVKAGHSITEKDIDKAISDMGMDGVQKHEERKKIIAGAVAGGIVAGDVGAVAGAVAAKAKIEEEKLNK